MSSRPHLALILSLGLVAGCGAPRRAAAPAPAAPSSRAATADDERAIRAVLAEFMAAIEAKSAERLGALVMDPHILFTSPGPTFTGVSTGGFPGFLQFVTTTPDRIAERFRNVEITQDGDLAWALFDYEFVANDAVANYGVEAWQMLKRDGRWRIFSVVWTQNYPAR